MPKQEGQKSKLVTLLRILEQRTDENYRLNVPQLVQLLENQGILAERKSIYSDIDTLRSLGYNIQLQRGRGGGYWMASRAFELSELKLLVDAVQSSSVISARTSKRIIHKLEALCSDYEGTQLQRQVYVDGRPKTDSQTLLYSIDALHTAINRGCLVQFRYKGSSAVRTVSPWQLAWENGCYYLIAYQDEKAPPVRHYRVDRMAGVLVLDEPRRGKEFFRTFDLPAYLRKHFNSSCGVCKVKINGKALYPCCSAKLCSISCSWARTAAGAVTSTLLPKPNTQPKNCWLTQMGTSKWKCSASSGQNTGSRPKRSRLPAQAL